MLQRHGRSMNNCDGFIFHNYLQGIKINVSRILISTLLHGEYCLSRAEMMLGCYSPGIPGATTGILLSYNPRLFFELTTPTLHSKHLARLHHPSRSNVAAR